MNSGMPTPSANRTPHCTFSPSRSKRIVPRRMLRVAPKVPADATESRSCGPGFAMEIPAAASGIEQLLSRHRSSFGEQIDRPDRSHHRHRPRPSPAEMLTSRSPQPNSSGNPEVESRPPLIAHLDSAMVCWRSLLLLHGVVPQPPARPRCGTPRANDEANSVLRTMTVREGTLGSRGDRPMAPGPRARPSCGSISFRELTDIATRSAVFWFADSQRDPRWRSVRVTGGGRLAAALLTCDDLRRGSEEGATGKRQYAWHR
jgi:hypothetical protein